MKRILVILLLLFGCDSPIEAEELHGCLDSQACNYNADANIDNNSCIYNDCVGECGGTAVEDCAGICEGNTVYDECGVCDGPGMVPQTYEDCEWEEDCGYVTVNLAPEDHYCEGGPNDGNYCYWNGDCNCLGMCGGYCHGWEEVWQCEDVYECDEYTVYECPD